MTNPMNTVMEWWEEIELVSWKQWLLLSIYFPGGHHAIGSAWVFCKWRIRPGLRLEIKGMQLLDLQYSCSLCICAAAFSPQFLFWQCGCTHLASPLLGSVINSRCILKTAFDSRINDGFYEGKYNRDVYENTYAYYLYFLASGRRCYH